MSEPTEKPYSFEIHPIRQKKTEAGFVITAPSVQRVSREELRWMLSAGATEEGTYLWAFDQESLQARREVEAEIAGPFNLVAATIRNIFNLDTYRALRKEQGKP